MNAGGERPAETANRRIDHVAIQSELKYLIGAKNVKSKSQVFDGYTRPFQMVRVIHMVRVVATVLFRAELEPEPSRKFGTVANTTQSKHSSECDISMRLLLQALS